MSDFRAALAALDDGALEAAASKGLVRRAHRDHEAGLAAVTRETPDGAELAVDGETVALGQRGLAAASCSCPSQTLCRHILAAVIVLRGVPNHTVEDTSGTVSNAATPAARDESDSDPLAALVAVTAADLVKAFGRAALRDAEAILAAASEGTDAIIVETVARACVIRLPGQPEVRYVADFGLAGMLSKAPAPIASAGDAKARRKPPSIKALHAAAVLAVRRRHVGEAPVADAARYVPTEAPAQTGKPAPNDAGFLDAVTSALAEAARAGLATAPVLLEERLLDLALSSRADALPRLAGALRGLAEDLSQRRARAAAFEPAAALAAIARAYALVLALRGAGDDPLLRGAVRQPYADLGALDLVGCGLELWRTPTGVRGATAYGLAQGAGGEGPRWYTITLARAAGQDPFFVPREAVRVEPVWGRSLETLAATSFHLEGARAADGRLSLGNETRLTMGDGGLARLREARPDLFVEDWSEIGRRLAALVSPSLRTSVRAVPLLLRPAAVEPVQFDATRQRAWLPVMDRAGRWLDLTIADDAEDTRLDAIIAMQAGKPRVLVAIATRVGDEIVLSPIAALAQESLESFDLYEPPRRVLAPRQTMLERLERGLGQLVGPRRSAIFAPITRTDATAALVAQAEDEALALAELGGRMEDPARLGKLGAIAVQLEAAGLAPLAALLSRLATAPTRERPLRLLAFTHAAACHAALAPRLPLMHRVS